MTPRWKHGLLFALSAASLFAAFVVVAVLESRYDLEVFYSIAMPVGVWTATAREHKQFFRKTWFWFASAGFIVVSTIISLEIPRLGSWMMRWMVVGTVEAIVFLFAVNALARWQGDER